MKKTLFAFCALAAVPFTSSAASVSVNVTNATDSQNPAALSSFNVLSGDSIVLKTTRGNMTQWVDYYLLSDITTLGVNSTYSSGGGGYHANYHIQLNAANSILETADSELIRFNTNGYGISGSSAGFFYESADGSAVTVNVTDATNGAVIKLATQDGNGETKDASKIVYGLRGRTLGIGENVTLNASKLNVSGRLITEQTEYVDSSLEVAGTINLTGTSGDGMFVSDADVNIASTGSITTAKNVSIQSNSKVKVEGSLSAASGFAVNASTLDIKAGGTVSQLDAEKASTFGGKSVVNVAGTFTAAQYFFFNDSTLNLLEGGVIRQLATETPTAFENSTVNVAGTGIFTTGAYIRSGTTVNINDGGNWYGRLVLQGGKVIVNSGATIAGGLDGTISTDMANDADSTLTVKSGSDISKVTALTLRGGTLTITDDMYIATLRSDPNATVGLTVAAGATYSAYETNFKSGSTVNFNGNISFSKGLGNWAKSLTIASGTTSVGVDQAESKNVLNNGGTINIASGANLVLNSALAGGWLIGDATKLGGTVNVDGGTLTLSSTLGESYAGVVQGNVNVVNNGKIVVSNSTTHLALTSGVLTTDSTARIEGGRGLLFAVSGSAYNAAKTVNIGSGNVFGNSIDVVVIRTTNNRISLASGDSYVFGKLKFHDYASGGINNEITFDLNGSQMSFTHFTCLSTATSGTVIFEDFAAGLVKVGNLTTELISKGTFKYANATYTLKAYDVGGKLLDGTWSVDDAGYLFNSALVPEPAEWACIFGALALALAAYRRRK